MSIISRIRNCLELSRLQKARAQVSIDYDAEIKRLVNSGLSEEEAASQSGGMHKADFRATHTNVVVFQSDRLVAEAERLQVPIPQNEEYWIQLKYASHVHLSEVGQAFLRAAIREERKARREVIGFWFNIITVILSLLIAVIALAK